MTKKLAAPQASSQPTSPSPTRRRSTKNAPMNVSSAAHAPYAATSATSQRRADRCATSVRSARLRALDEVAAGGIAASDERIAAARAATMPTTGATTIHASAFAPATQPIAQARRSGAKAAVPANPAESRQATAIPISTWARRNAAPRERLQSRRSR